jgi:hypothetical protein
MFYQILEILNSEKISCVVPNLGKGAECKGRIIFGFLSSAKCLAKIF